MVLHESTESLIRSIKALGVPDRSWKILWHRLGPGSNKTLEEVGEIFDLTRERIRQIQLGASKKISSRIDAVASVLSTLEKVAPREIFSIDESGVEKAYAWIERELNAANVSVDAENVQRLIVAIRAAPNKCGPLWPRLTFLTCFLHPIVKSYEPVGQEWEKIKAANKERERQWSYPELIEHVLERESKPLHWREIVVKARAVGRRRSVHPGSVMNTMIASEDFVRVAPGTYALKRQGYEEVDPLIDRIWKSITVIGRPAFLGEIVHELKKGDDFKSNSVSMHLALHPRFYTSIDGRYGLRILLHPPEEQTLRTPRDMIEDPDSHKRVTRAAKHGYNVEAILQADRESFEELEDYSEKRK